MAIKSNQHVIKTKNYCTQLHVAHCVRVCARVSVIKSIIAVRWKKSCVGISNNSETERQTK